MKLHWESSQLAVIRKDVIKLLPLNGSSSNYIKEMLSGGQLKCVMEILQYTHRDTHTALFFHWNGMFLLHSKFVFLLHNPITLQKSSFSIWLTVDKGVFDNDKFSFQIYFLNDFLLSHTQKSQPEVPTLKFLKVRKRQF